MSESKAESKRQIDINYLGVSVGQIISLKNLSTNVISKGEITAINRDNGSVLINHSISEYVYDEDTSLWTSIDGNGGSSSHFMVTIKNNDEEKNYVLGMRMTPKPSFYLGLTSGIALTALIFFGSSLWKKK